MHGIKPLGTLIPDKNDRFSINDIKNRWELLFNNFLPMELVTKVEYDSITHMSDKVYFVDEGENISVYINNKQTNKTNPLDTLCGKIEISITTNTTVAYAVMPTVRKHIIGAVMTLRNVYNNTSLNDFEPPDIQVHSVLYQGSLYAVLKSLSGNIPIGTYTVDWQATEVS